MAGVLFGAVVWPPDGHFHWFFVGDADFCDESSQDSGADVVVGVGEVADGFAHAGDHEFQAARIDTGGGKQAVKFSNAVFFGRDADAQVGDAAFHVFGWGIPCFDQVDQAGHPFAQRVQVLLHGIAFGAVSAFAVAQVCGGGGQAFGQYAILRQDQAQPFANCVFPGFGGKVVGGADALVAIIAPEVGMETAEAAARAVAEQRAAAEGATCDAGQGPGAFGTAFLAHSVAALTGRAGALLEGIASSLPGGGIHEETNRPAGIDEAEHGALAPSQVVVLAARLDAVLLEMSGNVQQRCAFGDHRPDRFHDSGGGGIADQHPLARFAGDEAAHRRGSPDEAAGCHAVAHAVADALCDHFPFPLGDAADHMEQQAAHRRIGGDLFCHADQGHLALFGEIHQFQQITQAPGQAVQPPGDDSSDFAALDGMQDLLDAWPVQRFSRLAGIADHLSDRQAPGQGMGAATGFLGLERDALFRLVLSGNPDVDQPGIRLGLGFGG